MEEILDFEAEEQLGYRPFASFWERLAAAFIDGFLLFFVVSLVLGLLMNTALKDALSEINTFDSYEEQEDAIVTIIIVYVIYFGFSMIGGWLYHAFMESSKHQGTIGKVAMNLQVVDLDGNPISFWKATARHFGKYISSIPVFLGFIMAALTAKKQSLHDMMSGCLIVKKKSQK